MAVTFRREPETERPRFKASRTGGERERERARLIDRSSTCWSRTPGLLQHDPLHHRHLHPHQQSTKATHPVDPPAALLYGDPKPPPAPPPLPPLGPQHLQTVNNMYKINVKKRRKHILHQTKHQKKPHSEEALPSTSASHGSSTGPSSSALSIP